jgi:choline monooxygenase
VIPLYAATLPHHYVDQTHFDAERDRLFSRLWIYAGLRSEVAQPNDYLVVTVGGRSVIVQNCSGKLKAFINSCSHRHARIQEHARGHRRLVCPYHGWAYDDEGRPAGIPGRDNFPQVTAQPDRFALRRVDLDCAGQFIFVRIEPQGTPLRAFLGHVWDFLLRTSEGLHEEMDHFEDSLAANWKLAIENALEGYHVPMVHRGTLGAITQFSPKQDDVTDHMPVENGHSYMTNKAETGWLERWKRYERALGHWPFNFDHYIHQLVFPNLTITSFMGYSFHIQRFQADAVGKTTVHSSIYSVKCDGQTPQGASIMKAVYEEGRRFTRKVFDEDKRVCELVQHGVRDAGRRAVLASVAEKRIAHFQRFYLAAMEPTG